MNSTPPARWHDLLEKAVKEPGSMSAAFRAFHSYSLGNRILAMFQADARGLPLAPIAPYKKWQELGRQVRKGERALTLCIPQAMKVSRKDETTGEETEDEVIARFVYAPRFFLLSQTDAIAGAAPYQPEPAPILDWTRERALAALHITEETFALLEGNCGGYAKRRDAEDAPKVIAVNPVWPEPVRVTVHEVAHHELGHTAEATMTDSPTTPRTLREVEAEGVALLVCDTLGLPGAEHSRAYIQNWYGEGNPIPEISARKIITTADRIIRAGLPKEATK